MELVIDVDLTMYGLCQKEGSSGYVNGKTLSSGKRASTSFQTHSLVGTKVFTPAPHSS